MKSPQPKRTTKDYLAVLASGFLMGTSDIIPGVSGGTMAFILGIYDELIDSIQSALPFLRDLFRLRWREAFAAFPWQFLLALGSGIALAILSLARLLHWALEEHPDYIYSVFFGLILASILAVRSRVKRWTPTAFIAVVLTAAGGYLLVGLTPSQTPESLWFIFFSGALAICAMILPGISGAFILVLLGKYQFILNALLSFQIVTILVFMAGAAFGLLAFSSILRWLLHHHHDLTVAALLGFMIGALREIWPWKDYLHVDEIPIGDVNVLPNLMAGETWLAIGLMAVGFGVVLLIELVALRRKSGADSPNQPKQQPS
jgi:putative membrane protein